ncbi:hypothetical protein Tco_0018379 [Tanacetum coccineum]
MDWGEVNPVHAYYNGSCTSKDNEDPSWSTSFKTRRTQKTSSALEGFRKDFNLLYLYMIGTFGDEYGERGDGGGVGKANNLSATSSERNGAGAWGRMDILAVTR